MTSDDDATPGRRLPRVGPSSQPPCAVNDDAVRLVVPAVPRLRTYSERCAALMRDELAPR